MSKIATPYKQLGQQIDLLIRRLALRNNLGMRDAMEDIADRTGYAPNTVYRWRQGRLCPKDEVLERLIQIGKTEADLHRQWGESLLSAARYTGASQLLETIWGTTQIRPILHNLIPPTYPTFVGRQAEIARLLDLLSPRRGAHLITVDGIGGVGKTALVLDVAYRCLQASTGRDSNPDVPVFDAIIFFSAKTEALTPGGILARTHTQRTLQDLAREVARVLNRPNISLATPEEQLNKVYEALDQQNTLLIVDNLETMHDKQGVIAFLYGLPPQVKIIITSRERVLYDYSPLRLEQLPEEAGLDLIRHQAVEKNLALDDDQSRALYQHASGVPVAIIYAIGQLSAAYSLETVLSRLVDHQGDVARFCFESSVAPLQGQPAHQLLMTMAMFPQSPLREAVITVSGLSKDPIGAEEGLVQLQRLSLIRQNEYRYNMLPLTREYALAELATHSEFEMEARERWVKWYLEFAHKCRAQDWKRWYTLHHRLEEEWRNLLAVFDWCADQDRYADLRAFWCEAGVNIFADRYGYWDDRLVWFDWLSNAAERRGDWPTAVFVISARAWTLVSMGNNEQIQTADELYKRAWSLKDYADLPTQHELATNIAALRIRQKDYSDALHWLAQAEILWKQNESELRKREHLWINMIYRWAEAYYWLADFGKAKELYKQVVDKSESIQWERSVINARNWLADIAIEEGDLEEADRLLRSGLPIAERNKEKRRTAFYKRSLAYLHKGKGNSLEAHQWASEAFDSFERLGMQPEAEEMRKLIYALEPAKS